MRRFIASLAFAGLLSGTSLSPAAAQQTGPIQVSSGIKYEFLARWDVDRLNKIMQVDMPKFAGVTVTNTPARNAVRLYRVTYNSVVPEKSNKPIVVSGLLAIPDVDAKSFPTVSYQHGTVYGREQVPSFPEQSDETRLMIAQFAGQGYVLMGSDYFGMGISTEPEGYMVKASHQQACTDMISAGRAVLDQMKITSGKLFLSGWSQGGFVTMACLEKLEKDGVKVDGAATASAPLDLSALMNGFLNLPRKNDAVWLNSIVILSAFAFENYYGIPGMARSVIADEYYDMAKAAYDRTALPNGKPVDPTAIPTDLHKLMKPEYFDSQYFAASAYGRLMNATESYHWLIKSPVRNYYGEADEAITVGVGRMAMTYQQAIGAGNPLVEAVSTGQTTHRGTFVTAVPQWKAWFDGR